MSWLRLTIIPFAFRLAVLVSPASTFAQGSDAVHGPIVTWHTDPLTTANIIWVESPRDPDQTPVAGTWNEGKAGFGFGDHDDTTDLPDMAGKFSRLYARRTFRLTEAPTNQKVYLQIRYDDGVIAYLNGKEVLRLQVKTGRGADADGIESHEADKDKFERFSIDGWDRLARVGENVLAIEVHNREKTSSDLTLDAYLTMEKEPDSSPILAKHESWHYMADGEPPRGWTTIDFPPLRTAPRAKSLPSRPDTQSDSGDTQLSGVDRVVYYRRKGTEKWQSRPAMMRPFGDTKDRVYWGLLSDLQAGTEYEFGVRVVPDGTANPVLKFRTAPAQWEYPFRFVTGGDMGSTDTARAMNRMVANLHPQFALIGGDLAYDNGRNLKAWHRWIDDWRFDATTDDGHCLPMVVAIGNHETGSGLTEARATELQTHKDAMFFFSLFPLPDQRPYYTLDFADQMSLVILDSNHIVPAKEQVEWLKNVLAERRNRPHLFVCYHRPTWATAKEPDMEVRQHWVPLFEQFPVTAVFENDNHTLKRTHRLLDGKVNDQGVLYLGDGAWGVETRDVPQPGERFYLAHADKQNHVWVVDIDRDKVRYQALDENEKRLDATETVVRP